MNDSFLSVSTVPLPQGLNIASTSDSNPVRFEKVPQERNGESIFYRQENDVRSPLHFVLAIKASDFSHQHIPGHNPGPRTTCTLHR